MGTRHLTSPFYYPPPPLFPFSTTNNPTTTCEMTNKLFIVLIVALGGTCMLLA
jgi:hypothetical protein